MYQIAIYICISWYSKICWFLVKKCWYQKNSRGVSRDSYNFLTFFKLGITVPGSIIVGYVWQILWRRAFLASHPWTDPKKPILNWVKKFTLLNNYVTVYLYHLQFYNSNSMLLLTIYIFKGLSWLYFAIQNFCS